MCVSAVVKPSICDTVKVSLVWLCQITEEWTLVFRLTVILKGFKAKTCHKIIPTQLFFFYSSELHVLYSVFHRLRWMLGYRPITWFKSGGTFSTVNLRCSTTISIWAKIENWSWLTWIFSLCRRTSPLLLEKKVLNSFCRKHLIGHCVVRKKLCRVSVRQL